MIDYLFLRETKNIALYLLILPSVVCLILQIYLEDVTNIPYSSPNIILYDRLIPLDHIILPFFLLGKLFRKVSFLITTETSELWEVLILKAFYSCKKVVPFCSFSSWHELLGIYFHINPYLLLFPSIELLLSCTPPQVRFFIEQIP